MNRDTFIEKLFASAKEAGFEDCEARYGQGSEFSCSVFKGEIVSYTSADSLGLSFRGIYNGKMGSASTQVLDEDAIDMLVTSAKRNAEIIGSTDPEFLYDGSGEYVAVNTFTPELENVTAEAKLELCRELERQTLGASGKVSQVDGCEVLSEMGESILVNTKGLNVSKKSNILGGYTSPVVKDGDAVNTSLRFAFVRDIRDFDAAKLAKEAVSEAEDGLTATSAASGETPVCIRGDAMYNILRTFSDSFSAESAQKGMSLLKGREGEKVAAECVTIVDDPHMPNMYSSTSFDGEGVPTKRKNVVEAGRLTTLLHNLKTAYRQGVETTGNGARNGAGGMDVAPSNFYIQPADTTREELLAKMGEGLLITDVQGLHSGANEVSGDFSLSAKGYFVREGKLSGAVKQITIAGNFYKLLENIVGVANDMEYSVPGTSTFGSPTVWVKSLAVAGSAQA